RLRRRPGALTRALHSVKRLATRSALARYVASLVSSPTRGTAAGLPDGAQAPCVADPAPIRRAIRELSRVPGGSRAMGSRRYLLRSHGSPTYEPHARDHDERSDRRHASDDDVP